MTWLHGAILVADVLLLVAFAVMVRRRGRRIGPLLIAAAVGALAVFVGATIVLLTG